jgi:hypothetical protein
MREDENNRHHDQSSISEKPRCDSSEHPHTFQSQPVVTDAADSVKGWRHYGRMAR